MEFECLSGISVIWRGYIKPNNYCINVTMIELPGANCPVMPVWKLDIPENKTTDIGVWMSFPAIAAEQNYFLYKFIEEKNRSSENDVDGRQTIIYWSWLTNLVMCATQSSIQIHVWDIFFAFQFDPLLMPSGLPVSFSSEFSFQTHKTLTLLTFQYSVVQE